MADITLRQDGQLPIATQVRYRDMGDGTYALVGSTCCEDADGNPVIPRLDADTGGQIVVSHYEADLHESNRFKASYLQPHGGELANDATHDFLIKVGALSAHATLRIAVGGDCDFLFYSKTTVSADGAALDSISKNRKNIGVAVMEVYSAPTVTGVGASLLSLFVPAGTKKALSGGDWGETAWILEQNTNYLVRITNRSGAAIQFSFSVGWSESQ